MAFKSRTPKREECIMPMQVVKFKDNKSDIVHCHDYERLSPQTKEMINRMTNKAIGKENEE